MHKHLSVCVCTMCIVPSGARRGHGVPHRWSQVIVSPMGVLETEPGSSPNTTSVLNHRALFPGSSSSVLEFFFLEIQNEPNSTHSCGNTARVHPSTVSASAISTYRRPSPPLRACGLVADHPFNPDGFALGAISGSV